MHRPPSSDHRARFLPRLNRMLGEVDVLLVAVAVGLAVTRLVTDAASIYAEILELSKRPRPILWSDRTGRL